MQHVNKQYSRMAVGVCSLIILYAPAGAGAPMYTVSEIESDGIHNYLLTDISETGFIAGSAYRSEGEIVWKYAVRVDPDLSLSFLDDDGSEAFGVNDDGDVTGRNSENLACIWIQEGRIVLDGLQGPDRGGTGYSILNDQTVVGYSLSPVDFFLHATLWIDEDPIDLGLLPGPGDESTFAYALTDDGEWIVGESRDYSQDISLAFLWNDGVMSSLGTLGGPQSVATGINNARQVVGWSTIENDFFPHAFTWQDGVITALPEPAGTMRSYANQINDYGEVIGRCDADYNSGPTTLWIGQRRYDVNNLLENWNGYDIRGGEAINNRGQIVAYTSFVHFVRLDPVFSLFDPEPGIAAESNTLRIFGSDEGNRIVFIYGFQEGSVSVPGCQGLTVDIRNPRLAGTAVANEDGRAQITGIVPGAARGRTTRFQAVDLDACVVTPVFDWTWE